MPCAYICTYIYIYIYPGVQGRGPPKRDPDPPWRLRASRRSPGRPRERPGHPRDAARIRCVFSDLEPDVFTYVSKLTLGLTHNQTHTDTHATHTHTTHTRTHTSTLLSRPLAFRYTSHVLAILDSYTQTHSRSDSPTHTETHSHSDSPALSLSYSGPLMPRLSRRHSQRKTSRQIDTHMGISASSKCLLAVSAFRRSKTAQEAPETAPRRPKRPPSGPQYGPREPQQAPKTVPQDHKTAPGLPK